MSLRGLHRAAVALYIGLIALLLAWLLWLSPPTNALLSVALITLIGPLLIPLRGVLYGWRYPMAWSCIIVLVHFVHGITHVPAPGIERWLGGTEIVVVALYFTAAILYIRRAPFSGEPSPGSRESGVQRGS